jgi:hypothetical protein
MVSSTYISARTWADKFNPEITRHLSSYFHTSNVKLSSIEDDQRKATDFIVDDFITVSARVRSFKHLDYKDQFTVRMSPGRDGRSELDKIEAGTVSYIFQGFATPDESQLFHFCLIDARKFAIDRLYAGVEYIECVIGDRSSFAAFAVDRYLVAQGGIK